MKQQTEYKANLYCLLLTVNTFKVTYGYIRLLYSDVHAGGYKGYGLAKMVEMLTGMLSDDRQNFVSLSFQTWNYTRAQCFGKI